MVTAYGQEDVISAEIDPGLLDGFLMKPVNTRALADTIMLAFGYSPISKVLVSGKSKSFKTLYGARVLLAEDNEINQQVARELLEQVHIHVTVVNNGQEAVDLLNQETFDGILMDMLYADHGWTGGDTTDSVPI